MIYNDERINRTLLLSKLVLTLFGQTFLFTFSSFSIIIPTTKCVHCFVLFRSNINYHEKNWFKLNKRTTAFNSAIFSTFYNSAQMEPKIEKSSFGKAAIGKKKKYDMNGWDYSTNATIKSSNITASTFKKKHQKRKAIRVPPSIEVVGNNSIIEERRETAFLALQRYVKLSKKTIVSFLDSHPRVYMECDDLSIKLLYLLNHVNLKSTQIRKMIQTHPRLMELVLLDNKENIPGTVDILQKELDLTINGIQDLKYPRSELRKRILVYKDELLYTKEDLRNLICKDPKILRTDAKNVRRLLKTLKDELDMGRFDIRAIIEKNILFLTYNSEKSIEPTIKYLQDSEIGKNLGLVKRKGLSTKLVNSDKEREDIIKQRLKLLIIDEPTILTSSIEKNLKPTVAFLLDDIGLSPNELGRVLHRRGGNILVANVERTLARKVEFLRNKLGLEMVHEDERISVTRTGNTKFQPIEVSVPPPIGVAKLTNHEKKRLLAQMIAKSPDILTLSIENNLIRKFDYFYGIVGFNEQQVLHLLYKRPHILSYNLERNIIPKFECFTKAHSAGGMGMNSDEVCKWVSENPDIMCCALETCIKPRVSRAVSLGLTIGKDLPANFITCKKKKWLSDFESKVEIKQDSSLKI